MSKISWNSRTNENKRSAQSHNNKQMSEFDITDRKLMRLTIEDSSKIKGYPVDIRERIKLVD